MFSDTDDRFRESCEWVRTNHQNVDTEDLYRLYGLYKQCTDGNCRVSFSLNPFAISKMNAWRALHGLSKGDAMIRYVEMVDRLRA